MSAKISKKRIAFEYVMLTLGAAIMAVSIGVFLVDAKVVGGGVSGLSMSIHYLFGFPVGVLMWLLNIPLYFWGIKELGSAFGFRTFYSFTVNSFFIDWFSGYSWVPFIPSFKFQETATVQGLIANDFFFAILLASIFMGVGLGIIFKFKGTTAGTDIVAAIMNKKFGTKPGVSIIIIDFFVISLYGVISEIKGLAPENTTTITLVLYGFFLLVVSSKLIDFIIDGFNYARVAYVVSEKFDEVSNTIVNDMQRGATAIKTRGLYKNMEREMLMTVLTNKEVPEFTDKVKETDPDAFIVITDAHEVLGNGFRRRR